MTEPLRLTDECLLPVLAELREREPIFHRREFGTSADQLRAQTDEQFWEVGASGLRYSREAVVTTRAELFASQPEPWEGGTWSTDDFCCQQIAPDLFLLTYTLDQAGRITRRSTLWSRASGQWLIVYHQGTVVAEP